MARRSRWRVGSVIGSGALAAAVVAGVVVERARADVARTSMGQRPIPPALPTVTVYKDPACGCCRTWVERMRAAGFDVQVHDVASATARDEIKRQQGITSALAACHTAVVGGYVVEGHVPPELVKRMLAEHPKIAGLVVPGMPAGSPGMEGMGTDHYDVLSFTGDGATRVYDKR
jgi:hypothetical protein